MRKVLGLDIGGANLKAAHTDKKAWSRRFALWKAPDGLDSELRRLMAVSPPYDHVAVTMTGELCDCFESKGQGVNHILDAVEALAGLLPVSVWTNEGSFVTLAEARQQPARVASANWLAVATLAGRLAPCGPALLIDIGTTTTDIIPLVDGRPVPEGRTDPERLQSGELVYLGWRRTPLCALPGTGQAAELFATTLDVYLALEAVPEDLADLDTADGRPASRAGANRRLARMLCGDLETTTPCQRRDFALEVNARVVGQIAMAAERVVQRLPGPPQAVIASESGEFLIPTMLPSVLSKWPMKDRPLISFTREFGPSASEAACAMSVAVLCQEALPP